MSKYEPLKQFLKGRPGQEAPMSFSEIEQALGFPLPRSARQHAPWWANETEGGHVQARAWLDAGWKTARVDVSGERVVFVRSAPRPLTASNPSAAPIRQAELVSIDIATLPAAAARLVLDYAKESNGDVSKAVVRGLCEAAIARRGRLIDRITADAPRSSLDSTTLVREDRDAR